MSLDRHRRLVPARFERETGLLRAVSGCIVNWLSNIKNLLTYLECVFCETRMHWNLRMFSGGIDEPQAQGTKARQNESAGEAVKSAYEDIVRQEGEMICKSRPVLCPTLSQRARKDGATHFCGQ